MEARPGAAAPAIVFGLTASVAGSPFLPFWPAVVLGLTVGMGFLAIRLAAWRR